MPGAASVSESSFTTGPATEHTRLLPGANADADADAAEPPPSARSLARAAAVSFAAAVATSALLLPCWLILRVVFAYTAAAWALDQGVPALALSAFLSLIVSLGRLRAAPRASAAPPSVALVIFALLVDTTLAVAILGWVMYMLTGLPSDVCYYQPEFSPSIEHCREWQVALRVLLFTACACASLGGLSHAVLALLRFFSLFEPNFWSRQPFLTVAAGEFNVEVFFGVRAMRRPPGAPSDVDERTEGETEGGTTEAGTER